MISLNRRTLLLAGAAALTPVVAFAREPEIYMDRGGLFGKGWTHAVGGRDVVAYFQLEEGAEATVGSEEFSTIYKGVSWLFSSQENLDAFLAAPDSYRPQYGGYCAWALARNKLAKGDPDVWHIYYGKLYLNVSTRYKREWLADIERDIARADDYWPGILDRS